MKNTYVAPETEIIILSEEDIQKEYEDGVQNNIDHSADDGGEHAYAREALRIDIAVHTGGEHGKKCAEKIDLQILVGIEEGILTCTEKKQDRLAQKITK